MALAEKAVALLTVTIVLHLKVSLAAVYKVGDSSGWTIIGNIDYKQWSATKSFQVGDTIIFQYNPQFHNVMRVTHAMYKSCNSSAPIDTYTTGNDTISISTKGHHFFICGAPGHCEAGQKLDINVPRAPVVAAAPTAVAAPPSVHSATVPGPSPASAASLNHLTGVFGHLGLAAAVFNLLFLV